MKRLVTDSIFASSLVCTYKCYLQLNGHRGSKSEYEEHMKNYDRMFEIWGLKRISAQYSALKIQHGASLPFQVIKRGVQILMVKRVEANGLQSDSDLLILDKKNNKLFEPVLFHRYDKISHREKLLLAYRAVVFGKAWSIMPTRGRIIHGEELNTVNVMLSPFIAKVEQIIHNIEELWNRKEPRSSCAITAIFASL